MTDYRNPYDFVPLEDSPTYVPAAPDQARISGYSGTLAFDLEVLTPLCIHHDPGQPNQQGHHEFARLNRTPTIPATSLKGMLRGVHEVVTNSTMGLLKSGHRGWYSQRVPRHYRPGENTTHLTPTEALFGMVGSQGDDSVGYAGRIFLDDIPITVALQPQGVSRPKGGMPKPEHESFYFECEHTGDILGRKFYYHQQDYRRVAKVYKGRGMQEITVQSVPAKTRLTVGHLRFFNLSHDEICSLIYTLMLEDTLAHKLGYGKPLGLGSVRLHITSLEVERVGEDTVPARFLSYGEPDREDWTGRVSELRDAAKNTWLGRPKGNQSYAAFVAIARWPQQENFIYPDYGFFKYEKGRPTKTTLWAYQGRATMHPVADNPQPDSKSTVTVATPANQQQPAKVPAMPSPEVKHRTGTLELIEGKHIVRDDETNTPYECITGVRKSLRRQVNQGNNPRVSFRPETLGEKLVAQDVKLLEGKA